MTSMRAMLYTRSLAPLVLVALTLGMPFPAMMTASAQPASAATSDAPPLDPNTDWPCIQHKQPTLTAAQMWDGPAIADEGKSSDDDTIRKLVLVVTSRRLPMEEVEKAIAEYAKSQPETERDKRLTELFEATLAEINSKRSLVMQGIEKFQRRQITRSKKLEQEGIDLAELQKKAEADPSLTSSLLEAQQRYDWDARVFQDRQQNMPLACEVPVLIEQRVFAVAQAIRAQMSN